MVKITLFPYETLYRLVHRYQRFGGNYCFLQLKLEITSFSETSLNNSLYGVTS